MALVACKECQKEISTEAKACPHCGFVRPSAPVQPKGIPGGVLVVLFIVAIFVVIGALGGATNQSVTSGLLAKQSQCRTNVSNLQSLGVRLQRADGRTDAEYDESLWARFDHDDKIRQALLIFCADMPQSGAYSVYIKGRKSGKILASVMNGNYFDN